ncbi:MAG: hypothetical protein OXI80_04220 [Caldilineaceae bacterium]|nr:hypothetical protein [Caldilineaceae bacterium]MDE0336854.1 hypothetical protein [Caldilineaceae bacterium]
MPVVDRPNKEALLKALDIFLDTVRPFFVECLDLTPGASARVSLERSLKGDQSISFSRNLRLCSNLESAIEVSLLATIAECYWEDIFSARLGGDRKVLRKLRRVTEARNRASHPPHLRDLDDDFTHGSLCHISYLLESIRAWEEHKAVSRLRDELGDSAKSFSGAADAATREMEAKLKEANAGILAAKNRARILEERTTEAHERAKAAKISLAHAEKEKSASEAAKQKAEDLVKRNELARQEAERRTMAAAAGQREADRQKLATIEVLRETERRLEEVEAELRHVQKREAPARADAFSSRDVIRPIQERRPLARNTPQYEDWLIGEIQNGNISRSKLCQYAGDSRVDGRLVHYVHAAASDMSHEAWNNYVDNRRETLARGRNSKDSQHQANSLHSRHGLYRKNSF